MNIALNLHDLELLDAGRLKAFAVPYSKDLDLLCDGNVIGIKEPFKRLTTTVSSIKKNILRREVRGR